FGITDAPLFYPILFGLAHIPRQTRAAGSGGRSISSFFWRLSPFPFAGLPVVASRPALGHFVAEQISRHKEAREVAAGEAERAKCYVDGDLQQQFAHGAVLLGSRRGAGHHRVE